MKLATDDGLCAFEDHAELGKIYLVDLRTVVRGQRMTNVEEGRDHAKDIVFSVDGGWLPMECLELLP